MFTFDELERQAYIKGEPELADIYDRIRELEELEYSIDDKLKDAYLDGHKDGYREGSPEELRHSLSELREINEVTTKKLETLLKETSQFLGWLSSPEASTKANRAAAVKTMFSKLVLIRSSSK